MIQILLKSNHALWLTTNSLKPFSLIQLKKLTNLEQELGFKEQASDVHGHLENEFKQQRTSH